MEGTLKDLKLESVIPKFAVERIEPENVSELSDVELARLGVTTIGDHHCISCTLCCRKKRHQSIAAAAPSE